MHCMYLICYPLEIPLQSCILPNKSCRSHLVHYPHAHNAASNPLQRLQMMLSENHRALLDCNFSHPIYAASFALSSCIRKRNSKLSQFLPTLLTMQSVSQVLCSLAACPQWLTQTDLKAQQLSDQGSPGGFENRTQTAIGIHDQRRWVLSTSPTKGLLFT